MPAELTVERLAVERVAEDVAKLAMKDMTLLSGNDPVSLVTPLLEDMEHPLLVRVATLLLQRFCGTVPSQDAAFEPLSAAVEQRLLKTLSKLQKCMEDHRTFQFAVSLTPLLARLVAVAAQCCCLIVYSLADVRLCVPMVDAIGVLADVLSDAVVDRVQCFRPLDCVKLSRSYQEFARHEAEIAVGFAAIQADGDSASRAAVTSLVPAPERRQYAWRNAELRKFWEMRVAPRYDGAAPIADVVVFLLRAAGLDTGLPNREAVMKRLSSLEAQDVGLLSPPELDRCSSEIRRCGGLRAWVNAVLVAAGAEAKPPLPPSVSSGKALSSTWGSSTQAVSMGGSGTLPAGNSTWPMLSARATGSSASTPRGDRKPFALTAAGLTRRAPRSTGNGDNHPLFDSVERNLLKTSQRLVLGEKAQVDVRHSTFSETPLHTAAVQDHKHAPIAALLLAGGADVHAEDRNLATPLHVAASAGNKEVASKLLARGAHAGKEDRWSSTPLHKASASGRSEMVRMLLDSGAAAHVADEWGATPLHRAVAHGQRNVAEQLLASGHADVNAEDHRGDHALHIAASLGDYALVKVMLEYGGTATARSRLSGKTPEDCARDRGHTNVVTLLQHRHEWIVPRSQAITVCA